ncbi:ACP S-malonyltransferase [Crossiella cryophila]|uniref:[acyl-carrier-protein] S-malonyltransferase n=1 Tax=Crossiella cryophila TaxID=43355 RepID=A0A7W7CA40_9PSEU|nr:ACP S-malonyltransferase [Crossiella cryophila]MBB4676098.1 [acyl-carrier-protein] S-malonyltransferase [Crossiella cryophila]
MADAIYFPGLVPTTFPAIASFLQENEYAQARLRAADEVLGYSLIKAYEHAEIYDWEVYEAGYMALTLALADWADDHLDLSPVVFGGQSFGAIIGSVYAGVLSYADGLTLVRESAKVELDYFAGLAEPLGCFFFYRLDGPAVDRLVARCRAEGRNVEASVYLDNSVHAVSGVMADLEYFRELVREEGGFPFYLMNRAEHCTMVAGLRQRLETEVYSKLDWRPARVPMLSDVTGELITDPQAIMTDLLDGWVTPVRWATVVEGIRRSRAEQAYIIGPRNMFSRLTGNTVPTAVVTPKAVEDYRVKGFAGPHGRVLPVPASA